MIESDGSSNEAEDEVDLFDQKEKDRKRRKLTRGLRKYTGVAPEGERKTKGWSDKGMVAFERWVGAILEDVNDDKYVAWGLFQAQVAHSVTFWRILYTVSTVT